MNSTERVRNLILGKEIDRQPVYGWLFANLTEQISERFGSVEVFEDKYEFDVAHLFGGPDVYNWDFINRVKLSDDEITPDVLVSEELFKSTENLADYDNIAASLRHHKERGRFCYVQTPGFFEAFNSVFGIQNHLMWLALYPNEIAELYKMQAEWNIRFADHCIDLGVDMIHISDDWGSQRDLMFSPKLWRELIYPNIKKVVDHVHSRGAFASLHSDGCISSVADGIVDIGLDVIHPWQESAGMSYDLYLEKYSDKFSILGGICVQTAIGLLPQNELEKEIRRVFEKLRGKRWICCTSHFVQDHCSIEDLIFAYDLIYKLARE